MATRRIASEPRKCQVEGCSRPNRARGYCSVHYVAAARKGEWPVNRGTCKIHGCSRPHEAKGYCNRHYQHLYHFGRIKSRTKTDPNIFTIDGDICRISLFNRNGELVKETIVDASDYHMVKDRKWYFRPSRYGGYVFSGEVALHRMLLGASPTEFGDHKDRDTLNNRRSNLRICTHGQNSQNSKTIGRPNKSGIKNVHWSTEQKKWRVEVKSKGIRYFIGSFKNIEDAKIAAHDAREKYHGEFCNHG